jgi:hypothetical protein
MIRKSHLIIEKRAVALLPDEPSDLANIKVHNIQPITGASTPNQPLSCRWDQLIINQSVCWS